MLFSIMFAAGIILSIVAVYGLTEQPPRISPTMAYSVLGFTFLTGLVAIQLATNHTRQTVVYLDHKKATDENNVTITNSDEQLTLAELENVLANRNDVSQNMVNAISKQLEAGQAALYTVQNEELVLACGYALSNDEAAKNTYKLGEGLVGRVANEGSSLYIDTLPKGYIVVFSGLGSASPTYLALVPLKADNEVKAVLELALFKPLNKSTLTQLETIGARWAQVL